MVVNPFSRLLSTEITIECKDMDKHCKHCDDVGEHMKSNC